jgi:hypothetical protein
MLLLENGQLVSGPPIHAQVPHACCQNRLKKSADFQRTQAGWTTVWHGLAPRIKGLQRYA